MPAQTVLSRTMFRPRHQWTIKPAVISRVITLIVQTGFRITATHPARIPRTAHLIPHPTKIHPALRARAMAHHRATQAIRIEILQENDGPAILRYDVSATATNRTISALRLSQIY